MANTTIEKTSKKWKALGAVSAGMLVTGMLAAIGHSDIGGPMMIGALVVSGVARLGAWWSNG